MYLFVNGIVSAQDIPPPPAGYRPGGNGSETGTPGAPGSHPSVQIDMLIYALGVVAIVLIIYFAKKLNESKK